MSTKHFGQLLRKNLMNVLILIKYLDGYLLNSEINSCALNLLSYSFSSIRYVIIFRCVCFHLTEHISRTKAFFFSRLGKTFKGRLLLRRNSQKHPL